MEDPSRREILAIIRRLASLGLLEVVRPALMRDSQFGELLAQTPPPVASGAPAAITPQSVNGIMAYLQTYVAEIAQLHQQLSGMLFDVSVNGSVADPGYQFSSQQSGFFSNNYAYEPLTNNNGPAQAVLAWAGGKAGAALGNAAAAETGPYTPIAAPILSELGSAAGSATLGQVGFDIDNAPTIYANTQTLLQEVSDWRSWLNVMQAWSGSPIQ
jgi:hypothetical protein